MCSWRRPCALHWKRYRSASGRLQVLLLSLLAGCNTYANNLGSSDPVLFQQHIEIGKITDLISEQREITNTCSHSIMFNCNESQTRKQYINALIAQCKKAVNHYNNRPPPTDYGDLPKEHELKQCGPQ